MLDDEHMARRVHTLTLAEFMGPGKVVPGLGVQDDEYIYVAESSVDFSSSVGILELTGGAVQDMDDYEIAGLGSPGDVVALARDEYDELEPVALYQGGTLVVLPAHRGVGLGAIMVLAHTIGLDTLPGMREYTASGWHTHVRAHRLAVGWAMDSGIAIDPSVLVGHPLLQARAAEMAAKATLATQAPRA